MQITFDPKYRSISNEIIAGYKAQGIVLSNYAEGLIRFAVESFLEEPPPLDSRIFREHMGAGRYEPVHELAPLISEIMYSALRDDHLQSAMKTHQTVKVYEIWVAVADFGRRVLKPWITKG